MTTGISVEEVAPVENKRSRLAAAVLTSLQFAPSFTDFLIHEGRPIRAKSAVGTVTLQEMSLPGIQDFNVTLAEIQGFVAGYVDVADKKQSPVDYWNTAILPTLKQMKAINRSISMPHGLYLRISIFFHNRGQVAMAIRVTAPPPSMNNIGFSGPVLKRLTMNPRGLLIITGPTASGKTSTAMAMLSHFNKTSSGHIITIEEPIEYPLISDHCSVTQREVGIDVENFGEGLDQALRQVPEVLLAGECRDQDAARAALFGGESGALMIVTTHGKSILGTIKKLLALCGDSSQLAMRQVLAGNLIAVIRQELIPHEDGQRYSLAQETLHGTDAVCALIQQGEWEKLRKICEQDNETPDFVPINKRINELMFEGKISSQVGEMVMSTKNIQ